MTNRISEAFHAVVPHDDSPQADIDRTETVIAMGAAIAGGVLARQIIKAGWKGARGEEPPVNPASREVDWKDALLWGAASGALVGAMRILSRRTASSAYRHFRR